MYLGSCFEGDVDMEVASKQHDVYHQATWDHRFEMQPVHRISRSLLGDADHPK